jgi:hypothetical protein
LENSTKTKARPKSDATTNEDVMQHIIKLNDRVDYMIDTLKTHADSINEHQGVLDRVRSRMGI